MVDNCKDVAIPHEMPSGDGVNRRLRNGVFRELDLKNGKSFILVTLQVFIVNSFWNRPPTSSIPILPGIGQRVRPVCTLGLGKTEDANIKNINGNFQWHLHRVALRPLFPIEMEFSSVDFCGGRKTGEPGEKPSERGREPTTNSTHI